MDLRDYLSQHGLSQAAFGERLDVSQGLVWQWLNGRTKITPERAIEIEALTQQKVTRAELRPDIFGAPSDRAVRRVDQWETCPNCGERFCSPGCHICEVRTAEPAA